MKIFNESDLLDINYRKAVLDEIEGVENIKRKDQMKRRYEVYKDNTKQFVLQMMQEESQDKQIVKEIINRMANISFCKKIISKKSQVYKDGAKREVVNFNVKSQEQVDKINDFIEINSVMFKVNRYVELFKNAAVHPIPYSDPKTGLYHYKPMVLAPFLYDVIEDVENPEIPRAYITSYYNTFHNQTNYAPENMSGVREAISNGEVVFRSGDGKDQKIADSPADEKVDNKEYVWWSNAYHFTTNRKGEIISGKQDDSLLNPIGELPFVNFSQEQDGHFWAVGGEDIIDGSILLNMLLSDLFYIAKYQGMGIGYMFGKGVPKNLKVGASSFVTLELKEGDPTPQIGFVTSNPPIDAHLGMMETYVALLLSTNKLDVSSIQTKLGSATTAASGIHEMIIKSENMEDIQTQRQIYRDGEPKIFEIIKKWHNIYASNNFLVPKLQDVGLINEDVEIMIKFNEAQAYVSEKEKLEIIKMRREIGLDTIIDSMIRDNPELTDKEAIAKLEKMLAQKLIESSNRLKMMESTDDIQEKEDKEENEIEEEEEENGEQDKLQN